jgi:hypothetical protein
MSNKLISKNTQIFNDDDFNSNDGMLTSVWGPSLWHTLHTMSFNYPVKPSREDKKKYKEFILNLQGVLPCRYCRDNLKKNLKVVPLNREALKNRTNFSRWMFNLHNQVNTMLDKNVNLTFTQVRNRYENFRSRCNLKKTTKQCEIFSKKTRSKRRKSGSKENGCTNSLYGLKSKCVINIVPQSCRKKTFKLDPRCKIKVL